MHAGWMVGEVLASPCHQDQDASSSTLQGVFCGDCLYMRYGENVEEVNANPGEVTDHLMSRQHG